MLFIPRSGFHCVCKDSEFWGDMQEKITLRVIFSVDEVPEWDSELMDKEEMEYPTTNRGNGRIFRWGRTPDHKSGDANLNKQHFLMVGSWVGIRFLFYVLRFFLTMGIVRAQYSKCHPRHFFISRLSVGKIGEGIREVKETAILTKVLFLSFGVFWSFLGSSLVLPWSLIRGIYTRYKEKNS